MATETRKVLVKVDIDRKGADTGLGSIKKGGEKATKSLKDTQKSAKDTSKSLQTMAADTKIFGVSVNSLSTGFSSMRAIIGKTIVSLKIFKTALISTGIGALIIAAGALIVFLTRMQSGMDIVSKAAAQLGAVVDVILDRLAALGKVIIGFGSAVVKAFKGDFKGAMEAATEAGEGLKDVFTGIGEEIANDVQLAGELADAIVELEIAEIGLIAPFAEIRKAIAQNLLDSKDQEKSAKRRLGAVKQAALLEEAILLKQIALQTERVRIAKAEFERAESSREDERRFNEERAKLFQIEEASLKKRASIAAQIEKFTKAVAKEEEVAAEEKRVIAEFEELEKQLNHEQALMRPGQELEAFKLASVEKIQIKSEEVNAITQLSQEQLDKELNQRRQNAEKEKALAAAKEAVLVNFAQQGLASQKKFSKIASQFNQALAIKDIFVSTREAIMKAAAKLPFPLSLVVGAFFAALGIAQAAAVAGVSFASGGIVPGQSKTGDRVHIRANSGEVILNDQQQARLGGDATFRKIGVPGFQGGGVVPASIAPDIPDFDTIADAISQIKVVATIEDINDGQERVAIGENRATI